MSGIWTIHPLRIWQGFVTSAKCISAVCSRRKRAFRRSNTKPPCACKRRKNGLRLTTFPSGRSHGHWGMRRRILFSNLKRITAYRLWRTVGNIRGDFFHVFVLKANKNGYICNSFCVLFVFTRSFYNIF